MVTPSMHRFFAVAVVAASTSLQGPSAAADGPPSGTDWMAPLDHYCERVGLDFWAEPFNAITNLAFLVAAGMILARQRRLAWSDVPLTGLALVAALVGVGSFLFHTFANRWSLIADILPIAVFIYGYFFLALQRLLQLHAVTAGLATAALLALSPGIETLVRPVLGASASYAPGLVATFGVAFAVPTFRQGPTPPLLVAAGLAFTLALVFRMLDAPLCGVWPTGTHFLWHMLNALALAFALLAVERAPSTSENARYPFVGEEAGAKAH